MRTQVIRTLYSCFARNAVTVNQSIGRIQLHIVSLPGDVTFGLRRRDACLPARLLERLNAAVRLALGHVCMTTWLHFYFYGTCMFRTFTLRLAVLANRCRQDSRRWTIRWRTSQCGWRWVTPASGWDHLRIYTMQVVPLQIQRIRRMVTMPFLLQLFACETAIQSG